jgi:hypothetical protein
MREWLRQEEIEHGSVDHDDFLYQQKIDFGLTEDETRRPSTEKDGKLVRGTLEWG